jgi:hypothetical protein
MIKDNKYGEFKGEVCNRNGCKGMIEEREQEGCSCHINPPCSQCVDPKEYCPECGWDARDEYETIINDYTCRVDKKSSVILSYKPRPLDNTKIDWHSKAHTHFSMIKEGVYPEGTDIKEVKEKVKGTFGGRFEYFNNGKFKYIAYTD